MKTQYPSTRTSSRDDDRPFHELVEDYLAPQQMMEVDDRDIAVRRAVTRLSEPDRNLLLLYAEGGSFRKIAKRFGVTHPTISKKIRQIQGTVKADVAASIRRMRG